MNTQIETKKCHILTVYCCKLKSAIDCNADFGKDTKLRHAFMLFWKGKSQ